MDYKSTLNITHTDFPMKANLFQSELDRLKFWDEIGLYQKIREKNKGKVKYILHDGPPFANGDIHMGTALNKTLKDIIVKFMSLKGWDAPFVPGWDCHGMPIEHKIVEQLGDHIHQLSKVEIRQRCREYALNYVNRHIQQFKRLGVFGNFDNPYLTLSLDYESKIVEAFHDMLNQGFITRGVKPILWCTVCHSALAEAEVEYASHESTAITVAFQVKKVPPNSLKKTPLEFLKILIWTTTPWTLPANLGICLNPKFVYVTVKVNSNIYIVAKSLLNSVAQTCQWSDYQILEEITGSEMEYAVCRHPFLEKDVLVMVGDHVTADTGTGCVHTAPGHGREDFEAGLKYHLPIYSPVTENGVYDSTVEKYHGLSIWEANEKIIEQLRLTGNLLFKDKLVHSYPHCWRCKNPVIFRSTTQWFIQIEKHELRNRCLEAIRQVQWHPTWGQERISNMVQGRSDWCISRQRTWGVPITIIYCQTCEQPVIDKQLTENILTLIKNRGVDAWFDIESKDLLPLNYVHTCGGTQFKKENDILDVWFESGISHLAVLKMRSELQWPADLYLEGGDQYRGWFQSSLWIAVALMGQAPYHSVLTHGWVLDAHGRAMHKSAGNVINPMEIVEKFGADILRLWVSAQDYTEDVSFGYEMLERISEAYRRIRNTFRFMMGNLYDFEPVHHEIKDENQLEALDQWALLEMGQLLLRITEYYEAWNFTKIFHEIEFFCAVQLSARYFDILKDRLYTFEKDSLSRRSAQTALYRILKTLVIIIAPILSFTAEEIWGKLPESFKMAPSVFLTNWPSTDSMELLSHVVVKDEWENLFLLKEEISKSIEHLRKDKIIGSSLQAEVFIFCKEDQWNQLLEKHFQNLSSYFLVSQVTLSREVPPADDVKSTLIPKISLRVRKTEHQKCARCWNYFSSVGTNLDFSDLCDRCIPIVQKHSRLEK
jgi:isoleucyl-tRNA synthetase